ncbi:Rgg family transcriptional regulator [Streptococcus equinus]|uniref:Rgg family transcriptional regulator n=1 Tax=Streptococcus equinus TaxID=1335 RepID=UPI0040485950
MDEKEMMSLGELYRELRMARGLKLKDVAGQKLSVSQLSKFENEQSMLTADKLLVAISAIHMSFSEFGHALNHYQESSYFRLGNQLANLQVAGDIEGLKEVLKNFEADENFDTYNRLTRIDIVSAIYALDTSYEIKEDDKQFLTQYLYSIEQWTEYELYLFGNTMSILSDADLIFLGRALAERNEFYLSLPQHKKAAQLTFINIILALIERNQLYYTTYFMTKLESMINYQDMFTVVFLTFLKDTLAYLKGETDDVQPMRECIEMVKKLGNPTMAKLLEEHLEQFIK